jgi:hypothetical protein
MHAVDAFRGAQLFGDILGNTERFRADIGLISFLFVNSNDLKKQREKILTPMADPIANIPQETMKMFAGHSAERIEPVLGIAPEALDAVEMVPSFGPTFLPADHRMIPLDAQRTVRMPVIGVVRTARLRMRMDQSDDPISFPYRNGKHLQPTGELQDPQHDDLAGSSPTELPRRSPPRGMVGGKAAEIGKSQNYL